MSHQYCSRKCQLEHWQWHKVDCKSPLKKTDWKPSWEVEKRKPTFLSGIEPMTSQLSHGQRKYLWGNVPAFDILNLENNEGVGHPDDVRLLFAGMCPGPNPNGNLGTDTV